MSQFVLDELPELHLVYWDCDDRIFLLIAAPTARKAQQPKSRPLPKPNIHHRF